MTEKRRKKGEADTTAGGAVVPISYRPSAEVSAAMGDYLARFKVKPAKSAVIERALREFFRNEGIDIEVEEGDGGD